MDAVAGGRRVAISFVRDSESAASGLAEGPSGKAAAAAAEGEAPTVIPAGAFTLAPASFLPEPGESPSPGAPVALARPEGEAAKAPLRLPSGMDAGGGTSAGCAFKASSCGMWLARGRGGQRMARWRSCARLGAPALPMEPASGAGCAPPDGTLGAAR